MVSVARWNLKEAACRMQVGQTLDSMNRNRIEGRDNWVSLHGTVRPECHSGSRSGKSGECQEKGIRLTLGDVCNCPGEPDYQAGHSGGRVRTSQHRPEHVAEAIEGPNLQRQGTEGETRRLWRTVKARGPNRGFSSKQGSVRRDKRSSK